MISWRVKLPCWLNVLKCMILFKMQKYEVKYYTHQTNTLLRLCLISKIPSWLARLVQTRSEWQSYAMHSALPETVSIVCWCALFWVLCNVVDFRVLRQLTVDMSLLWGVAEKLFWLLKVKVVLMALKTLQTCLHENICATFLMNLRLFDQDQCYFNWKCKPFTLLP